MCIFPHMFKACECFYVIYKFFMNSTLSHSYLLYIHSCNFKWLFLLLSYVLPEFMGNALPPTSYEPGPYVAKEGGDDDDDDDEMAPDS